MQRILLALVVSVLGGMNDGTEVSPEVLPSGSQGAELNVVFASRTKATDPQMALLASDSREQIYSRSEALDCKVLFRENVYFVFPRDLYNIGWGEDILTSIQILSNLAGTAEPWLKLSDLPPNERRALSRFWAASGPNWEDWAALTRRSSFALGMAKRAEVTLKHGDKEVMIPILGSSPQIPEEFAQPPATAAEMSAWEHAASPWAIDDRTVLLTARGDLDASDRLRKKALFLEAIAEELDRQDEKIQIALAALRKALQAVGIQTGKPLPNASHQEKLVAVVALMKSGHFATREEATSFLESAIVTKTRGSATLCALLQNDAGRTTLIHTPMFVSRFKPATRN